MLKFEKEVITVILFSPTVQLQHLDQLSDRFGTWRTSE